MFFAKDVPRQDFLRDDAHEEASVAQTCGILVCQINGEQPWTMTHWGNTNNFRSFNIHPTVVMRRTMDGAGDDVFPYTIRSDSSSRMQDPLELVELGKNLGSQWFHGWKGRWTFCTKRCWISGFPNFEWQAQALHKMLSKNGGIQSENYIFGSLFPSKNGNGGTGEFGMTYKWGWNSSLLKQRRRAMLA